MKHMIKKSLRVCACAWKFVCMRFVLVRVGFCLAFFTFFAFENQRMRVSYYRVENVEKKKKIKEEQKGGFEGGAPCV